MTGYWKRIGVGQLSGPNRPLIGHMACNLAALASFLVLAACGELPFNPVGTEAYQTERQLQFSKQLMNDGKAAEAQSVLMQIAQTGTRDAQRVAALQQLGDSYLRQNNLSAAQASFNELLLIDPDNGRALTGLGIALNLQKRPGEAEVVLRQAVSRGEIRAYSPLGVALDTQNKHAEAQAMYFQVQRLEPSRKEILANLAISYALSGNVAAARKTSTDLNSLLVVPRRYRRNHVMILTIAGDEAAAVLEGKRLELSLEEIDGAIKAGRAILRYPEGRRGSYLMSLLI